MAKYGVNVPKGVAVSSVDEIKKAMQDVFPNQSEVIVCNSRHWCVLSFIPVESDLYLAAA